MTKRRWFSVFVLGLVLLASLGIASIDRTDAAPVPANATHRIVMQDGEAREVVYLEQVAVSATGSGSAVCGLGKYDLHSFQLKLVGTPAGTNPTFAFVMQHSIDGGTTWHTAYTFTQVNATVTPSSQLASVADVKATAANAYGDCFRINYTLGGTNPSATFEVVGYSQD